MHAHRVWYWYEVLYNVMTDDNLSIGNQEYGLNNIFQLVSTLKIAY